MKYSVNIDIIQARFILRNGVSFSTNALPIARKTIASILHKTGQENPNVPAIQLQIPPRSEILHALSTPKFFVPYFILASLEKT